MSARSFGIVVLLASVLGLAGSGLAAERAAATIVFTCDGFTPTILAFSGTVYGTGGPDIIVATGPMTTVYGLGGDDRICAGDFSVVYAGSGDDIVGPLDTGGDCAAVIFGGSGADNLTCAFDIYGDSGNDILFGGDNLYGGSGNDSLNTGITFCDGGSGIDTAVNCPLGSTVRVP